MSVILLDLNYTLVANSQHKVSPFKDQILSEVYRFDLLQKLMSHGHTILLVTARPKAYQDITLASIREKTNWVPHSYYFNNGDAPPESKRKALENHIFPLFGENADFLAIESNPKTRKMYSEYHIRSMTYHEYMKTVGC